MSAKVTHTPSFEQFQTLAARAPSSVGGSSAVAASGDQSHSRAIPIYRTLLADHLTPVTAYERLAKRPGAEYAFLLESVVGGERIARYSFLATSPRTIIKAAGKQVTIETRGAGAEARMQRFDSDDPLRELEKLLTPIEAVRLQAPAVLPSFIGGAVGYAGYDTVRYLEPEKLTGVPRDDRALPDLLFGIYDEIVIFDHVQKTVLVLANAHIPMQNRTRSVSEGAQNGTRSVSEGAKSSPGVTSSPLSLRAIYDHAAARIQSIVDALEEPHAASLSSIDLAREDRPAFTTNMTQQQYENAVLAAKEYIQSGDIFQVVLSQRLQAVTAARPFDIYRALRVINPSPFMFYLASPECILVGSSPEIMCRVQDNVITNRPLAGTRRRGGTEAEDKALEEDLLADPKERAEHIMLVDLGRNDVGRAAEIGSVKVSDCMTVEKYSHVMHIVSNVSGKLAADKTVFDALRLALPVGTVSGAPKIRAMQIIDELEPTKRGPYAGAVGYIDYNRNVDTAIALRTMVITPGPGSPPVSHTVFVQAGAGIVADSVPASEYQECLNKASALLKAVALAEQGL